MTWAAPLTRSAGAASPVTGQSLSPRLWPNTRPCKPDKADMWVSERPGCWLARLGAASAFNLFPKVPPGTLTPGEPPSSHQALAGTDRAPLRTIPRYVQTLRHGRV